MISEHINYFILLMLHYVWSFSVLLEYLNFVFLINIILSKFMLINVIYFQVRYNNYSINLKNRITYSMDMSLSKLWELVMDNWMDNWNNGSLACCSPWGLKKSETTERLNWTETLIMSNDCDRIKQTKSKDNFYYTFNDCFHNYYQSHWQ